MANSKARTKLNITPKQEKNIAKYIRSCEVDRVQLNHFEDAYHACADEVQKKPNSMEMLFIFGTGLLLGVVAQRGVR